MNLAELRDKLFITLQHCVPQHSLSRLTGWLAESEIPWLKDFLIRLFSRFFNINIAEAVPADYEKYPSFNAFFTRPLKPGARPIAAGEQVIVSPADGSISEIGSIDKQRVLQAKGQYYNLTALLGGNTVLADEFANGAFATVYLSPSDYHRVHMPFAGNLRKTIYVPGKLFSVNQTTADNVEGLFARNERLVCIFDTAHGPMALILVGAMIVAAIETVWDGQIAPNDMQAIKTDTTHSIALDKGEEMGRFKLGSTAIVLFPANTVSWNNMLSNGSTIRLGESLGNINN
jgi:phosphatidylserine decarboxylase